MYTAEQISKSSKILYYLMQHGELSDDKERELYRTYSENEDIMNLVRLQGAEFGCAIQKYSGVIYLIPNEENDFLGYSKTDLKKELCRSNANDKDYYLSQFVILTLLVEIYGSSGKSSKSRTFIKYGEILNIVTERLSKAAQSENIDDLEKKSGIAFTNISERWEALKSSDKASLSKTTKEGFVATILNFLESQGLINFIREDDMVLPTPKLDNFMDWNILNRNNYKRILQAFKEAANE
ncbi:MAG: DUF6063 family protein [Clostridiales bacterium]|nr:DUF6063 family protein [Clostridiales bacterium]